MITGLGLPTLCGGGVLIMGSWTPVFGPGLATAVLLLQALAALAHDGPTAHSQGAPAMSIDVCIRELGSDSFAAREQAAHKLVDLGIAARDALLEASADPDAEVRMRARAILATVFESDFRDRLEAFSADHDGSHKKTLPGWEQFAASFGTGTLARQLFVDMQRAEPELLEALVKGGKPASEALDARCRGVIQQAAQTPPDGRLTLGTVASLLLVGASEGVSVDEQVGGQLFPWLIWQPVFQKNARESNRATMLKKLLGMWVLKDASPAASTENLKFAALFDLKIEGLNLAIRLLADQQSAAAAKANAILIVGKFGGPQQVSMIEKLLDDKTGCSSVQGTNPPRQFELQLRDVALAIVVRLTGQNLRDYGFQSVQPHPTTLFQVGTLTFSAPGVREAALKKWSRWRAEHPGS
jgi:hypothetical protein